MEKKASLKLSLGEDKILEKLSPSEFEKLNEKLAQKQYMPKAENKKGIELE